MKYNFINCHECEVYDHQVEFFMHCSSVKFHCEFKKLYFTIMVLPSKTISESQSSVWWVRREVREGYEAMRESRYYWG